MRIINIHEAKTHLSRIVESVANGEDVIIAKAGKPMARLTKYSKSNKPRTPGGRLKGKIKIADDFDELPEDIAAAFRGEMP